jgi:hypothetical protein
MPEVLELLRNQGWELFIVSRHQVEDALRLLEGVLHVERSHCIYAETKRVPVGELLRTRPDFREVVCLDDNPSNVADIASIHDSRVRPIGFLGTRKYVPELSQTCRRLRIEMVFTAPDLAETFGVDLKNPPVESFDKREWAMLIPALDHPASATHGETRWYDHRWPVPALQTLGGKWWRYAWPQLGWITCNECLWKVLVWSLIEAAGSTWERVMGNLEPADKAHHYQAQLLRCPEELKLRLRPVVSLALDAIQRGIADIGTDAECCRPPSRKPFEPDRIRRTIERLKRTRLL